MLISRKNARGFTIVELLIVIVVIGILASITIVAYNGVTQQASAVVLKSDLHNAASQLEIDKASANSETYAADDSALIRSEGTNFEYTSDGSTYCLSATSDTSNISAYHISSAAGSIEEGVCAGHTPPSNGSSATIPPAQVAKLLAGDGAASDKFGYSVSISGDTAMIGADDDDDNGSSSGSAYVFTRSGTSWTQEAKLLASDGAANDFFGRSVSISGGTAVIGAPGSSSSSISGFAYVFE
jgi:prepilin-type N-terminal cleavage/methylation domain-containing protein